MKTYTDHGNTLQDDAGRWVPKDPLNRDYVQALLDLATGKAQSVPAPAPAEVATSAPSRSIAIALNATGGIDADVAKALIKAITDATG